MKAKVSMKVMWPCSSSFYIYCSLTLMSSWFPRSTCAFVPLYVFSCR